MMLQKCEGIVLHAIKFKDYDQILTLFTPNLGLLKMLIKGAYSRRLGQGANLDILHQAEFVFTKRHNALAVCRERKVLNSNFELRKSLSSLESSCTMAKAVLCSQVEERPADQLYELLKCYLKRISLSNQPAILASSFLLKLLRHEGLFGLTPCCNICSIDLNEYFVYQGECYCSSHSPIEAIPLSIFEAKSLFTLAFSRSFSDIENTPLEPDLEKKIKWLFDSLIQG